MIDVSVVSGTINRLDSLKRMVDSVRKSVGELSYEIVLVDNDSTDGTKDWCLQQDDVKYFNIGEPRGAVPAFNLGFSKASGRYVVIMNDDVAINGDTIQRAFRLMEDGPDIGQIAFAHKYQNRSRVSPNAEIIQRAFGYIYGQCSMVRRSLGDAVDWWGTNYISYAGDTRLSLRLWEIGYRVIELQGCSVTDFEIADATRQQFSHDLTVAGNGKHPDTTKFYDEWRDRLPKPDLWIQAPIDNVLFKASCGTLRTLRIKGSMNPHLPPRTACINAFAEYGHAFQVDKSRFTARGGQTSALANQINRVMKDFMPDIVLFQAQSPHNSFEPSYIRSLVSKYRGTLFLNFDGDTHYPLQRFHFDVAASVHLQLLISPSCFPAYIKNGVYNVAYWPIGIENEYLDMNRASRLGGPDVLFLASLYAKSNFPENKTRSDAAQALIRAGLNLKIFGMGWDNVGLEAQQTLEQHSDNAKRYSGAKMALSISQTKDYWGYTSDRLYNITATGCPALVQRFAGMDEHGYVDGETCIAWSTMDELVDKTRYYISHDDERERIGAQGRIMTHSRHTWPHRVENLLAMLADLWMQ